MNTLLPPTVSPPSRGLHSTWHTVRFAWQPTAAVVFPIFLPLISVGLDTALRGEGNSMLLMGAGALGASLALCLLVANTNSFKYNPFTRRIEAGGGSRFEQRISPGGGYARLEFSPVSGEVHEVAFSGRRRRVPIGSHSANRSDWTRFIERMFPDGTAPISVRHRHSWNGSGRVTPAPLTSEQGAITVGVNRRRHRRAAAVAVPVGLVSIATALFVVGSGTVWGGVLLGGGGGLLVAGISGLCRRRYFTYCSQRWTIESRSRWGPTRTYPSPGALRLEYSPALGEIHEARADGRRRRLFISRHLADPRDWEAFVTSFHPSPAPIPARTNPSGDRHEDRRDRVRSRWHPPMTSDDAR